MTRRIPVPVWADDESGRRILVEATDPLKREVVAKILDRKGYAVRTCGGPEATDEQCPLAAGEDCEGAARAEVIVHAMRHSDPRNREVLVALQRRHPGVPLVVEVPTPVVDRHPEDFENCQVLPQPMTSAALLDAVDGALAS